MRPHLTLDPERLNDLLSYNKRTGMLTWKQDRRGGVKRGDEAGCLDSKGLVIVTIDRKVYPAARLAWAIATEQWPKGRIRYRNGDSQDLRFENLYDEATEPSKTKAAGYLRTYRRDMRELNRRLKASPYLMNEYRNNPIDTSARLRDQIRHERMQEEAEQERERNEAARSYAAKHKALGVLAKEAEERQLYLQLKAKYERAADE